MDGRETSLIRDTRSVLRLSVFVVVFFLSVLSSLC